MVDSALKRSTDEWGGDLWFITKHQPVTCQRQHAGPIKNSLFVSSVSNTACWDISRTWFTFAMHHSCRAVQWNEGVNRFLLYYCSYFIMKKWRAERQQAGDSIYGMQFNRCCGKRQHWQEERWMCGVKSSSGFCPLSMRWRQAEESRTVKRENTEERGKKDSWPGCRTHCITSVFNKRHSSIDPSGENFSKHPAELKGRRDLSAALIEGFLF